MAEARDDQARPLTRWVAAVSGLLSVGLLVAHLVLDSQLALAQAADSLMDALAAAALAWAVWIARQPADDDHPAGHTSAEPLAALGIAALAGVLAVQVAQQAVQALLGGAQVLATAWLLGLFVAKGLFKLGVMEWARRARGGGISPALHALQVDARNDVLLALVSVTGWLGAREGIATLDAWLSLPIAAWIGVSGLQLALDNLRLLMGAAPSEARRAELQALAEQVPGVRGVHDLRAHYQGTLLQVHLHVVVDPALSIAEAHEIGDAVSRRLQAEQDVEHCAVHIDISMYD